MRIDEHDVLLVIDVQNNSCPGGVLAVPRGDEVIVPIQSVAPRFGLIVLTCPGAAFCVHSALCLSDFYCFSWSWVLSADLHVIERYVYSWIRVLPEEE